jgi:hypothetical protein
MFSDRLRNTLFSGESMPPGNGRAAQNLRRLNCAGDFEDSYVPANEARKKSKIESGLKNINSRSRGKRSLKF